MYEVGRAGGHVSGQAWRHRRRGALLASAAVVLGAAGTGGLVLALVVGAPIVRALAAALAAVAGAGCVLLMRRSKRTFRLARRAAIGARSEREVRDAVRRTASIAAGYGIVLGGRGGDCDVVVFTRGRGAAAIEVKTGHGEVTVTGDAMRAGRRTLHGNPVRQAANQARWLSRRLRRQGVLAVVCVPGMTNRPFAVDGVQVCGVRGLGEILASAPGVFGSADEAKAAMARLAAADPRDGTGGALGLQG